MVFTDLPKLKNDQKYKTPSVYGVSNICSLLTFRNILKTTVSEELSSAKMDTVSYKRVQLSQSLVGWLKRVIKFACLCHCSVVVIEEPMCSKR